MEYSQKITVQLILTAIFMRQKMHVPQNKWFCPGLTALRLSQAHILIQ
jgi:hypothetical protein